MSFTYDPTQPSGQVRLLIPDTDASTPANQIFSDAEIAAFLSLNDQNVRLSAAMALGVVASDSGKRAVALKVLDIQVDGSKAASIFLDAAKFLLQQETESGYFAIAGMVNDPSSWREQIFKSSERRCA